MKKLFFTIMVAACTLSASAQHVEWSAASLPAPADGVAQGYQDYWGIGYRLPDNYVLCEGSGFSAVIENGTLATSGNGKYSGAAYPAKILMGMNNSSRDGIDPSFFMLGLAESGYLRTSNYSNAGVEYTHSDAIITVKVAAETDGGQYGMVTLTYNRGGNLSAMYVVDQTANNGEGRMVLQSRTRCPDDNIQDHIARFGVEPGHTYYIVASEKNSVELYGIAFDACASDQYEQNISTENADVVWTAASLPAPADGVAQGYQDYWGIGYRLPDNYVLCEGSGFSAVIENGTLATSGNGKYSGAAYPAKILMGMNNSSRDGIDPSFFMLGLAESGYLRTSNYSNAGVEYTHSDAIITVKVAAEADGGQYGRVTLNYNRGGNLSAMYVVDQTANNGEGRMTLQSRTRCPDDVIKTHTAQFGVEPGHTYYIVASEKNSVELYGVAFTPASSTLYAAGGTTGIENVVTSTVATPTDGKIYTIDGRYVGKNAENLVKGLYIMNGKKFMVK